MKVYVVWFDGYDNSCVEGVFLKKEDAEKAIRGCNENYQIEECEVYE
jgi:hypothetical protein